MGRIEHLFRESMRNYNDYCNAGDLFAVCWFSYLQSLIDSDTTGDCSFVDANIYRIKADSKRDAAKKFLTQKYLESYKESTPDCKENCIREIIDSVYKNGEMECLKSDSVLRNLFYDIETVIDGEYYTVDANDTRDESTKRTEAIMKNIDYEEALERLSYPVIVDVFVEAHLYDVAVISLSHVPVGLGYGSLSGLR